MKEVEVKVKVDDLGPIKQKLESLGCSFSDPIIQDDRIYIKNGTGLGDARKGVIAMRLRDAKGKHVFNMKIEGENPLDNEEHETQVEDPEAINAMLQKLDYYNASRVHKQRQKCKYQGMEICLDEVEGLGSFIETEKLIEEGESEPVQEEMFSWLESLGVPREGRVVKGYDIMLYEQSQKSA
ncbi:MAG: class IV adenylate cyclase [Patescibacteria group bacterium]|nr:class IV adenylate cyclase [bacterium]MDZ4221585.1 class IV adenylate cyclase [Patescibacteria group bacterium]